MNRVCIYRCLLDAEGDHRVGLFRVQVFGYGLQWEESLSFVWLVGSTWFCSGGC